MKSITRIIIASSIGFLGFKSHAQTIAIKGGLNLSKIVENTDFIEDLNGFSIKYTTGLHIGATVDLPISKMFSVETGIFASTSGAKYKAKYSDFGEVFKYKVNWNILNAELPATFKVNFKVKDNLKVFIGAGGYAAMNIIGVYTSKIQYGSEVSRESDITGFDDLNDTRFDAGLRFDTGIEIKGFIVGASYNFGFMPAIFNGTNRIIKVSLGYRFGWNKA